MIVGLRGLDYESQLKRCNLMSLEMRRLRADLLEVFKIMHGLEGLDREDIFTLQEGGHGTRGHSLKIFKQRARLTVRKFFFSQRVVQEWNNLSQEAVQAGSVNIFKRHIGKYLRHVGGLTISQRRLPAPVPRATNDLYTFIT